jgi:hypothetical protein
MALTEEIAATEPEPTKQRHPAWGWTLTALAALLLFTALILPTTLGKLTPAAFLRIPIEGLVVIALLLVLPAKARKPVAIAFGVLLAILTILKIVDIGFYAVLNRPFDLVLDWSVFGNGFDFLHATLGRLGAIAAVIGIAFFVAALVAGTALAANRLTRQMAPYRKRTAQITGGAAAVWTVLAITGAQIVPGLPVASRSDATLAYDRTLQVRDSLGDRSEFERISATDQFRTTPTSQLLTDLRGKDVLLTFVESYGQVAVDDPQISPQINAVLADGDRRLTAAGFQSRSAFLVSPTFGGGSWLAHATINAGLWIDNQQRDNELTHSDRFTLTKAFQHAGWQTVAVQPGTRTEWTDAGFYGFDRTLDARNLGYYGPEYGWSTMPDQYTLSAFERLEYGKANRSPLMAEIILTSSHWPWVPTPKFIDWNTVGDGSIYKSIPNDGASHDAIWSDARKVKQAYADAIQYSLESLISFVETYGDDNLVLVFLGDHQPIPVVSGEDATYQVPITIVAHDPKVLDRISSWGWRPGLRPDADAPIWIMDAFRDRFLAAFGPQ